MAPNRVTSLEECEHRKLTSSRPRQTEEDGTHAPLGNQTLNSKNPDALSTSSPSIATRHSIEERSGFNSATGPSWNRREADDEWSFIEEERVLSGDDSDGDDESVRVFGLGRPIPRLDAAFNEPVAGFGNSTGAFEVGKWKRLGEFWHTFWFHAPSFFWGRWHRPRS